MIWIITLDEKKLSISARSYHGNLELERAANPVEKDSRKRSHLTSHNAITGLLAELFRIVNRYRKQRKPDSMRREVHFHSVKPGQTYKFAVNWMKKRNYHHNRNIEYPLQEHCQGITKRGNNCRQEGKNQSNNNEKFGSMIFAKLKISAISNN